MFTSTVQPALVSLFSSVGSDPLQLFSASVDPALPSDSIIHLLNDQTSLPLPNSDAQLISLPYSDSSSSDSQPDSLACTVLHIQSPTIKTTFIRCPNDTSKSLGLTHQWFHMQFRDVGREFSFEIGLCDLVGRVGVVRCSTFQVGQSHIPFKHKKTETRLFDSATRMILESKVSTHLSSMFHSPHHSPTPPRTGALSPWTSPQSSLILQTPTPDVKSKTHVRTISCRLESSNTQPT